MLKISGRLGIESHCPHVWACTIKMKQRYGKHASESDGPEWLFPAPRCEPRECTPQAPLPDASLRHSCSQLQEGRLTSSWAPQDLSLLSRPPLPLHLPWAHSFSASGSSIQAHCRGRAWVFLLLLLTCLITKGPLGSSSLQNVPATAQERGARKRLGEQLLLPAGPPTVPPTPGGGGRDVSGASRQSPALGKCRKAGGGPHPRAAPHVTIMGWGGQGKTPPLTWFL